MEIGEPKRVIEVVPFENPFPFAIPGFDPPPPEPVRREEKPQPESEPVPA